jgi:integrase
MATNEVTSPSIPAQTYPLDASLTLTEASFVWFEEHRRHLKPKTIKGYAATLRQLSAFFADTLVKDVQIRHIREYQTERLKRCGPYQINSEVIILMMILKEAGQWKRMSEFYKPLRAPRRVAGHSLSQEEEARLREAAFTKPKWILAGHCMLVMLSTTMGFGELSHVRRCDVDLTRMSVRVSDGKNRYRDRTIPLNSAAAESMRWLVDRWKRLGGARDDQFLLPHRPRSNGGPWEFYEPQTTMRTAFDGIKKAAGLPHFRVYDCRVQAITKLLSNPAVSPQVSREIAGHISQAMQSLYSIQQFSSKKAALDGLEDHSAPPPPDGPPSSPQGSAGLDLMSAAVQAEIARQVTLALQQRDQERSFPGNEQPGKGGRVIRFPGAG